MLRIAQTIRLRPERREEYLALHREVWPGVEAALRAANIRNYSIFLRGDILFSYFEYHGDDFDADIASIAADPETRALVDADRPLPGAVARHRTRRELVRPERDLAPERGDARVTARRVAYTGARTIVVDEAAEPRRRGPGEVRIDVAYTGICGTDLHICHGDMDARVGTPAVIGHEMSGRIAAVGAGVDGLAVGDAGHRHAAALVRRLPRLPGRAHTHICHRLDFIGIDSPGAMQSALERAGRHAGPRCRTDLRLDHAALVEPTAVAVHDVRRARAATAASRRSWSAAARSACSSRWSRGAPAPTSCVVEPDPYRRARRRGARPRAPRPGGRRRRRRGRRSGPTAPAPTWPSRSPAPRPA